MPLKLGSISSTHCSSHNVRPRSRGMGPFREILNVFEPAMLRLVPGTELVYVQQATAPCGDRF